MKYLLAIISIFSMFGCASISEYNQGCRDGVQNLGVGSRPDYVVKYCNGLDDAHRAKEKLKQGAKR